MSADSCSDFARTDPDISGIGVRVSFYVQVTLLVLLVDRSWKDAAISLWTFIATSFGLVVAAIVNHKNLTFFEALQVSNLVWLANFGTFVALASYSRQKAASQHQRKKYNKPVITERDYGVKYGAMLQTLLSMALTIYMWATAPTFGPSPECSHLLVYVLFRFKLPALGSGRIVGMTVSSILTVLYLAITIHEIRSYRSTKKSSGEKPGTQPAQVPDDLEKQGSSPLRQPSRRGTVTLPSPTLPRNTTSSLVCAPVARSDSDGPNSVLSLDPSFSPASRRRPRRRRWALDLDPMLIGVLICQVLVFIYFIVSCEFLLRYNKDDNEDDDQRNDFAFGQILALVVVVPGFLSLVGAFRDNGLRRLSKKKRKTVKKKVPKGVQMYH